MGDVPLTTTRWCCKVARASGLEQPLLEKRSAMSCPAAMRLLKDSVQARLQELQ